MRLGSANIYDRTLENINARQTAMSALQEKLSLGKQVVRPSDDPAAAAQAERAMTRIDRIKSEQKALALQRDTLAATESSLGSAVSLMQSARELLVSAGDANYGPAEHNSIAQQLISIRDQLFTLANQQDSNGQPLFGGLGSSGTPFTDTPTGVVFNGVNGQQSPTETTVPYTMNGPAVWLNIPTGNGVFNAAFGNTNTGTMTPDAGVVTDPAQLQRDADNVLNSYQIQFSVSTAAGGATSTSYTITNTTTGTAVGGAQPYTPGQSIAFDGMSIKVSGNPNSGDTLNVTPPYTDIFKTLDDAIAGIQGAAANSPTLKQRMQQSLGQIDNGMDRLSSARGLAGDWLNRADSISASQEGRSIQLESDRSRAEDLDMVKGISDFQSQQTGFDAALKSYAQVQKLSLFNYIS